MNDFALRDSPAGNAAEFTVSEISTALKRTVEDAFGNVRVRGEISGYRGPHSSGHAYFSLKDDRARIEAVIWKGTFSRLKFRPEEGMEVVAHGKLTTYPGSSKYQIVIDSLEPAGVGALMALIEERRKRLAGEGLFAEERKQLLPFMPRVVGVVTSPTGAVIRDIIHRISDRFPLHVIVWPVRVQGETTGAEVSAAVRGFNALPDGGAIARPDVIIVARGGGSLEDLWGFNDEAVVRAVADSDIPVISAVGHETDWTLVDYAADVRAPTPTGAAELAVPVKAELQAQLASLGARLRGCMSRGLDRRRQGLRATGRALPSPDQLLALPRRRFDEAGGRLERGLAASTAAKRGRLASIHLSPATLTRRIEETRRLTARDLARAQAALTAMVRARRAELTREGNQLPKCAGAFLRGRRQAFASSAARLSPEPIARLGLRGRDRVAVVARRLDQASGRQFELAHRRLAHAERLMGALSHQSVLERGFALVQDATTGTLITRSAGVGPGQALTLRFADGTAPATAGSGASAPRPSTKRTPTTPDDQGRLL